MAKNIYRSAMGKAVDIDALRLTNEEAVAVGNMRVNARGDQLGAGGEVSKPKRDVMGDYYNSNAVYTQEQVHQVRNTNARAGARLSVDGPDPDNIFQSPVPNNGKLVQSQQPSLVEQELAHEDQRAESVPAEGRSMRGNLADAVAKTATVNQELLKPRKNRGDGPTRI
jgi:hypothetical protein